MKRVVILTVLVAAGLAAAEVSTDVRKYLGSASALFEKLEYEKALAQLKRAKVKSQGPEDDLKIALLEGVVLAEMGDATAPSVFASALGMDPSATLPMVVSPKVQRVFDKAKAQVQKVLDAQAAVEKQKEDARRKDDEDRRKQEEANRPPEPKPEPAPVIVQQPKPQPSGGLRRIAWVPAAVGVVSAGVGTVLLVQASSAHGQLTNNGPTNKEEALAIANRGASMQVAGWVLVGVGAAAVVAAAGMFAFGGGSGGASASVLVTPSGAFASVALPLP
ncbi:MAG: hypothetical protein IPJ65_39395 [Archangiaceae bacterium]|nr:hypothetical protein [Archangiaceae bacterium]